MSNLLSFSLWGNNPKYCVGAIKNAKLSSIFYPDWICRFYVAKDVSTSVLDQIKQYPNTEIFIMSGPSDWTASFWRFLPMADPTINFFISRDTDSRPSARESAAVQEWIFSQKPFHIMRDHPYHGTQILAGMWGCIPKYFVSAGISMQEFKKMNAYDTDQSWLRTVIYPVVQGECMVHDEFFDKKPFPTVRVGLEYVGEPVDQDDKPCDPIHRESLRKALINL